MVFDIRGKRKHVVKVVYAILALLMAGSLFLVTGGANISSLFGGNSSSSNNLAIEYEKRSERIETELQKQPGDEKLLANLTNNRMLAGQQRYAAGPNGEAVPTVESRTQYLKASSAWSEYLEATQEPNISLAQRMASVLFGLAQISRTYPEIEANIAAAAEAQKIYTEQRPTLNSLSTQAIYVAYTGDFKAAEEVNAEAEKQAGTKFQREQLGNQFEATKKTATELQKRIAEAEKAGKEAVTNEAAGGAGANPLGTPFVGGSGE